MAKVDPQRGQSQDLAAAAQAPATQAVALAFAEDEEVGMRVCPPVGWKLDPVKRSESHVHKTWISPGGGTAYGVIRVRLPLPLSDELTLWGYMREMRRTEGEAILLAKQWDPEIKAMRFEAEGGLYRVRNILRVKGRTAWVVYAGTLRQREVDPTELAQAIEAREQTTLLR